MTDPRLASLWTSYVPAYGVVRHVFSRGDFAAQFDDLNSDYREVCLTILEWHKGDWAEVTSDDDCGLPEQGEWSNSGWVNALRGGRAWSVGRGQPNGEVSVRLHGKEYVARTDSGGWWLVVVRARKPEHVPFRWPGR
ncbi:hypothetical protein [Nocardioides sp. WS12]|uniref:hypothetical protein n=1 Tax=Nocardioides sp. WS12 TaxID=2486272 RepID=UPI0015FA1914|nr:hypothetical protein [Nocardioides sp. WS12]